MANLPDDLAEVGITAVEVLRLQPGDAIVLKTEKHLSMYDAEKARDKLRAWFEGHEVIVLDGGASLQVAHKDGEPS